MSVRRDSLQSSQSQRVCTKHKQKLATHQLAGKTSPHDAYYCEKCSITLASQGYNVIKLATVTEIPAIKKSSFTNRNQRSSSSKKYAIMSNRKNLISLFMQGLQSLNFQVTQKIQDIQEYLMKSQSAHGRIIEEANKFYKELEQAIQLQKYITYNSILNKRLIDQQKARQAKETVLQVYREIQTIINDIRQNMDAVQTVDYSIYNSIMGSYQAKAQKLKLVIKQPIYLKPIQKLDIQLPQIPKSLLSLSTKILIKTKRQFFSQTPSSIQNSRNSNILNSITTIKPQIIVTQDDQVCMPYQNEQQQMSINEEDEYILNKQNLQKKINQKDYSNPKQITNGQRIMNMLAFSFDQNSIQGQQQQLKIYEDLNELDGFNLMVIKQFEQGKLRKIQQRKNYKQVCQSRQSLGEYLNIQTSRDRYFAQDTQTLLII